MSSGYLLYIFQRERERERERVPFGAISNNYARTNQCIYILNTLPPHLKGSIVLYQQSMYTVHMSNSRLVYYKQTL